MTNARHALRKVARTYTNLLVAARLRRHRRGRPVDELRFVRGFKWLGFRFEPLWQKDSEIIALLELAGGARSVVEIGSAGGGAAYLLAGVAAEDASIVCVD